MKSKDLLDLVRAAIDRQGAIAANLDGSDNPQTILAYHQTVATKETLQAVADAICAPRPLAAYSLQLLAKSSANQAWKASDSPAFLCSIKL